MFKGMLNALKWGTLGLALGQLVSGYKKEKSFKSEIDTAQGFDKLKVVGKYLFTTNKKLIEEIKIDELLESVKNTASQAQDQVASIKKEQIVEIKDQIVEKTEQTMEKVKNQAKGTRDNILTMLQNKLVIIEDELTNFESNAKEYAEDTRTEYYRQLASKFALFKKTVARYALEGALLAEEQFELESKLKYLTERLEELKNGK